eukprot:m.176177 g.176177  ORF g.176177 m.176177 type:complete len:303 (+) comp15438_c0_seq13:115-1023(+)
MDFKLRRSYHKECLKCKKEAVDTLVKGWRKVTYPGIEAFRKVYKTKHEFDEKQKGKLERFLEESEHDYKELLNKLETKYNPTGATSVRRRQKIALVLQHHIYIYLGDLERYRCMLLFSGPVTSRDVFHGNDISLCKDYYKRAMHLCPKNGKPYNQLAIMAAQGDKNLITAIYYYIRSLSVRQPILTARDALTSAFEKMRRKYEKVEAELDTAREKQKIKQKKSKKPKAASKIIPLSGQFIWKFPGHKEQNIDNNDVGDDESNDDEDNNEFADSKGERFTQRHVHILLVLVGNESRTQEPLHQ